MEIIFQSQLKGFKFNWEEKYSEWLLEVSKLENKSIESLAYNFVGKGKIIEINRKFLAHDYYTDIITFDSGYFNLLLGEIYICVPIVRENSIDNSSGNFEYELARVIVHGLLHLIGYKDKSEMDIALMREKEDTYLKLLSER